MPRLTGVLETALYVDDLEQARSFYERLFELPVLYSDGRMCAYDVSGGGVLLLFQQGASTKAVEMPGGVIPAHDGHGPAHIAFSIAAADLPAWENRLAEFGIEIEARMTWPRGGRSLYFRDPDQHLLEVATPGLWPGY
jgi:catechol 2,3-dioxygenase-like lactoylglutathione lyase family enzyme